MPFRTLAMLACLVVLAGCAPQTAPTREPTPQSTTASGPRTLRDLIATAPEKPVLKADASAMQQGDGFLSLPASYVSEGLTITGLLYVPDGDGPFPGVVVVHGAVDPATFTTGSDLVREQEALARSGHLVFAPDLRGYGSADADPSAGTDLGVGATEDVVNAGRALAASGIPVLDPTRIGLF
ncbi:MAG TPA: hypothetical protein VGO65_07120, partial [Pseudolysinimonas sp.]|nr:hypothetical protein [Pseudolysinimonas sp.]